MTTTPCKGCGKPIVWGVDAMGQRIPLDPSAPVYRMDEQPDGSIVAARDLRYAVSHFKTCPKANEFSGRSKK